MRNLKIPHLFYFLGIKLKYLFINSLIVGIS